MAGRRRSTATRPMRTKGEDNGQKKKASNGGCIARPTEADALTARTGRSTERAIAYEQGSNTSLWHHQAPVGLSQGQVPGSCQEHGPSLHPVRPGQLLSGPAGTGGHIGRGPSNTGADQGRKVGPGTPPRPEIPAEAPPMTLFST